MTNTSLALIAVAVLATNRQIAWLMLVVAAVLFLAYRAYASLREQHEQLGRLHHFTRVVTQTERAGDVAATILTETRELLRAERAELTVFSDSRGPLRMILGAEGQLVTGPANDPGPVAELLQRAAANEQAVLLVSSTIDDDALRQALLDQGIADAMVAPVRAGAGVLGALLVANRLGDVSAFGRQDLTLLQTLARQAGGALARGQLVDDLHRAAAEREHQALHDPLTGLPNRTLFTQELARTLAAPPAPRLAVCFVGLDRFKLINGTFGPAVGDRVLVLVAEQLRALADEHDCLVARIGGDEFAFLVPDTTCTDDALKFADRALRRIAEPVCLDGRDLPLSASAGVLERAADGGDPEDVMRAVGVTLQWAKADGRARCAQFDPERNTGDVARYALSAAMPAGLRNDEFVLFYQPLVELGSERPVGMEALARWRHPVRGLLSPNEFIGLAEDSGLIVGLGLRLLEKACRQAEAWRWALGPASPFVSVNLAVQQIRDPGLVAQVADVLDRVGLPPELLQLEITESAVMSIDDHSLGTLRALRRLGVRLVIDDFGTGYANLSYLCDLPVDGLKLAATFMHGLGDDPDCKRSALLDAMVAVGHRVGLSVTAEGVETPAQADRLRRLGCDLAQGWLFGRPVPPEELFS